MSEKPPAAMAGEATKSSSGQRLPKASIHLRVYFCLARVAAALPSVAAGAGAAAAAAERSVNTYTAHLRLHLVICSGSQLPSSSAPTLRDVYVTVCYKLASCPTKQQTGHTSAFSGSYLVTDDSSFTSTHPNMSTFISSKLH